MFQRKRSWLALVNLLALGIVGCCAKQANVSTSIPSANVTDVETYAIAKRADLRLTIYGIKPGFHGFPYVILELANISARDIVVAYTGGAATVHCGQYAQPGPAETIGRRRQVLEPGGFILIDPPESGWTGVTPDGQPELMIPTTLPAGEYAVSATFQMAGVQGGVLSSDKRKYVSK